MSTQDDWPEAYESRPELPEFPRAARDLLMYLQFPGQDEEDRDPESVPPLWAIGGTVLLPLLVTEGLSDYATPVPSRHDHVRLWGTGREAEWNRSWPNRSTTTSYVSTVWARSSRAPSYFSALESSFHFYIRKTPCVLFLPCPSPPVVLPVRRVDRDMGPGSSAGWDYGGHAPPPLG